MARGWCAFLNRQSICYGSYAATYMERDIKKLSQVDDEEKFIRFMTVLAARNGQLLNL